MRDDYKGGRPPRDTYKSGSGKSDSYKPRFSSGDRGRPEGRGQDGPRSESRGDRPFRKSFDGNDRPSREDRGSRGEREFSGSRFSVGKPSFGKPSFKRDDGDRPYQKRDGDRDRSERSSFGDKKWGDKKPYQKRQDGEEQGFDRPFRAREDRPFRKPFESSDRPSFRDKKPFNSFGRGSSDRGSSDSERSFKPRFDKPRFDDRPHYNDRPRNFDRKPREERVFVPVDTAEPIVQDERIAKVIARAGVASRRDAEQMIAEGRVTLNGSVLDSPAINVSQTDRIEVDGEPLPLRERTRLWLYHKPRGLVTTAYDPEGRPTVFENLPEELPRVISIGRLDINTEGLLLLTNDGGLAKVIAHPDTGWLRRYKIRAHGDVTQAQLDELRQGVTIDEMEYGPIEAVLDRTQGDNVWITMGLREGKNREVKRILEHLGLQVNRLIRLSFGPFQLSDLEVGLADEVKTRFLKDQLGPDLSAQAQVDFASPVREPIEERRERRQDSRPKFDRGSDRPFDKKPFGHKPFGDRPFKDKPFGERGRFGDKPDFKKPKEDRPYSQSEGAAHRFGRSERVWRDDEAEGRTPHFGSKKPRRGADPREAREASSERKRERIGSFKSHSDRDVKVERMVSEPREERRPSRPFRSEKPFKSSYGDRSGRPAGRGPGRGPRRDD